MSLPLQWREWAIPLMLYDVRCSELGLTAHSDTVLPSDGDEEDRASEREPLASSPALSERSHRRFACRLVSVRGASYLAVMAACPHPL